MAVLAATFALSACTTGKSSARGTEVVVVEHDFRLVASKTVLPPGTVTFHVENHGPSTHEFVVDETFYRADALPLEKSGLQVNEASARLHTADSLGEIRVGTTRDLTMKLTPGHYVMFCNLEGHYLGGMHFAFEVRS